MDETFVLFHLSILCFSLSFSLSLSLSRILSSLKYSGYKLNVVYLRSNERKHNLRKIS